MIETLEADVAALQRLSETDPLESPYAEFGLCRQGTCQSPLNLSTCVVTCFAAATCNRRSTQRSAPPE